VPKGVVLKVLEAAGWAPSAHNSQPWRFIVLQDPKVKRELAERMAEAWAADGTHHGYELDERLIHKRTRHFTDTPVIILACLTVDGLRKLPDKSRYMIEHDLAVESIAAGIENLLLAAHGAGLGACWYSAPAFCMNVVRGVLKIPSDVEPLALITLGYAVENPLAPPKKALRDYCYLDVWDNPLS